jgi:hypothetical protein
MRRNNILLTALGTAAAAWAVNYLRTPKGQEMLSNYSGKVKDLVGKASDYVNAHMPRKSESQVQA